ncbi:MAG: cold shock domain-containing protein [Deltaproteobacteria bacterium]|nr:MAG: cold shock domain-containing protein [Deltaproteobacteria bacterium]
MKEQGTVKFFNDQRGFGFIAREGKPDMFVHYKQIVQNGNGRRTLFEGDEVEFEPGQGPKGACAENVRRV